MSKIIKKAKRSVRRCSKPCAVPEVVTITPDDFKFQKTPNGNIVAVTLQTTGGKPIRYNVPFEEWVKGLSAGTRFLNQHLMPLLGW